MTMGRLGTDGGSTGVIFYSVLTEAVCDSVEIEVVFISVEFILAMCYS